MWIYGVDFSGARDPSRGLYYARGVLKRGSLTIDQIIQCDDRLDIFKAILHSPSPWGIDSPFSLPKMAFQELGLETWPTLLETVYHLTRDAFLQRLGDMFQSSCEGRCKRGSIYCRGTDVATASFSPLKRTNPNMRSMLYGGLKLLYHLYHCGCRIYPFQNLNRKVSRLYEVYPSHTWRRLGLTRNKDLGELQERFKREYDFQLYVAPSLLHTESIHAADAVVACLTLAYVQGRWQIDNDWERFYPWVQREEWAEASKEGLIVRVS